MSFRGSTRSTVILSNSPVPFAIMGASETHRRVLIRSDDRNLDLVGLDDGTFRYELNAEWKRSPGFLGVILSSEPQAFIVRTFTEDSPPVSSADSRISQLSFAWRGLASERDVSQIEMTFSMIAADLIVALDKSTTESAEWQVAPLVALCHSKTNAFIRRRNRKRAALAFTLIVYGLIALGFILNLPFLVERLSHS